METYQSTYPSSKDVLTYEGETSDWTANIPPVTWHWWIGKKKLDTYVVCLTNKPPNRFHRFMMKTLLGFYSELGPYI